MSKLVCGIGVNDLRKVGPESPIYTIWIHMIRRCYEPATQKMKPSYRGCDVSLHWQVLSEFWFWAWPRWAPGLFLDKDIIEPGNKKYSPETCAFVSREVNNLLLDCPDQRGLYPRGVYLYKGRFRARLSQGGQPVGLGSFKTPEEAEVAYVKAKAAHIREVASRQTNSQVRVGLGEHARILENTIRGQAWAVMASPSLRHIRGASGHIRVTTPNPVSY